LVFNLPLSLFKRGRLWLKYLIWRKPKNYNGLSLLREKERDLIVTAYKIRCKYEVFGLDVMLLLVCPWYSITLFPSFKEGGCD